MHSTVTEGYVYEEREFTAGIEDGGRQLSSRSMDPGLRELHWQDLVVGYSYHVTQAIAMNCGHLVDRSVIINFLTDISISIRTWKT